MRKSDKTAAVILATLTIVISWLTHLDYNIIASEGLTLSSIVLAVYVAAILIWQRKWLQRKPMLKVNLLSWDNSLSTLSMPQHMQLQLLSLVVLLFCFLLKQRREYFKLLFSAFHLSDLQYMHSISSF